MSKISVTLLPSAGRPGPASAIAARADGHGVETALELARRLGRVVSPPGSGNTRDLWEALATIASHDLGMARAIEPHLDALLILSQAEAEADAEAQLPAPAGDQTFHVAAPNADTTSTWGVFAAEGGDDPLVARMTDGGWSLTGTKPWCSLADRLDRALVTAHLTGDERGLFAVDLRRAGVEVPTGTWHARGLSEIPSGSVSFRAVPASPVGGPGWYLTRPGFAWGGIGVASCWYGGAVGIARTLFAQAGDSPEPLMAGRPEGRAPGGYANYLSGELPTSDEVLVGLKA